MCHVVSVRAFAVCLLAATAFARIEPSFAQEGHPLRGSWIGICEGHVLHGEHVLVVLDWDGKEIRGVVNPGTDDIDISNAALDTDDWTLRFDAEATVEGERVHYVFEGKVQQLELWDRSIVGTCRSEDAAGDFRVFRQ